MSDEIGTCCQDGCEELALYRFTWPGRDEAGICGDHVRELRSVAASLGFHLQLIPVMRLDTTT